MVRVHLGRLIKGLKYYGEWKNITIKKIRTNSKEVEAGDLFIAIKGYKFDGHDFIDEAINRGASVIIYQIERSFSSDIIHLLVDNTRMALGIIANNYYHNITRKVKLIGITGTNGKTTISTLLFNFFEYYNKKSLLIGTNGIYYNDEIFESINTTPDLLLTIEMIYVAYQKGVRYVIMEVSSQAYDMLRVYGFDFNIAVFSNLTHEHLDYHKTMERYLNVKGSFLSSICKKRGNFVVLNKDDQAYFSYIKNLKAKYYSFGIKNKADYGAINIKKTLEKGTSFKLIYKYQKMDFQTFLLGEFNIYNILACIAVIDNMGMKIENFKSFLRFYVSISGRMEMLRINKRCFIIDYAHTPDGVLCVLESIREYVNSRIIVVIGCGGNRDSLKRPLIGDITTSNADYVIFTNDNPRNEEENDIISDILTGVVKDNYEVILNREAAIRRAITLSKENDCIAILGKGNEAYQIINNIKYPFNDKEIITRIYGKEEKQR